MKVKKFFIAAVACATLILGTSGTSSAAEVSSDFSTLQVESQELALGRPAPRRVQPPPPPPQRRVVRQTVSGTRRVQVTKRAPAPRHVHESHSGVKISIKI